MNNQIIKATAKQVARATVAANRGAIVKAAASAATAAAGAMMKKKNNNKKVNRTRGGQRPTFAPVTYWDQMVTTPVAYTARWGSGSKPLRFSRSEMVGSIQKDGSWWPYGENGFQVKSFAINPAASATFPWLSKIGILFDKYKFHKLVFRFVNTSGTTTQGTVMMGVDYDTLDAAPKNPTAFSQLAKYTAGPTFQPHSMSVPLNHPGNNSWLYTLDSSAGTKDLKTYNLGTFFVGLAATEAQWTSGTVGYLFVDYDVEFIDANSVTGVSKSDATIASTSQIGHFNTNGHEPEISTQTDGFQLDVRSDGSNITVDNNVDLASGTEIYIDFSATYSEAVSVTSVSAGAVELPCLTYANLFNNTARGGGHLKAVLDADVSSGALLFSIDVFTQGNIDSLYYTATVITPQ